MTETQSEIDRGLIFTVGEYIYFQDNDMIGRTWPDRENSIEYFYSRQTKHINGRQVPERLQS